ncbi:hypothetical protein WJX77_008551 [Trebouxia sp. C0004]
MLQAVRRATAALHGQCILRLVHQSKSRTPTLAVQLHCCTTTADTFTTSAVSCDRPTSAVSYTEEQIAEIRQRVFGTHIGNGLPSGRKLLRKKLIGDKVAAYYDHGEPMKDPMIVSLDAERRGVQLAALKRRGKGPPKKGQGKRAGKKKR